MKISKSKPAPTSNASTILQGTKFTGDIEASNAIRIDGEVIGNIICASKVVLGSHSVIHGDIEAEEIVVAGSVNGTITARTLVNLQPKATVDGHLLAKEFVIEAGAMFNGTCSMDQETPTMVLEAKQA